MVAPCEPVDRTRSPRTWRPSWAEACAPMARPPACSRLRSHCGRRSMAKDTWCPPATHLSRRSRWTSSRRAGRLWMPAWRPDWLRPWSSRTCATLAASRRSPCARRGTTWPTRSPAWDGGVRPRNACELRGSLRGRDAAWASGRSRSGGDLGVRQGVAAVRDLDVLRVRGTRGRPRPRGLRARPPARRQPRDHGTGIRPVAGRRRRCTGRYGRPPASGDRLVQDALGATLERLAEAERGADGREAGLDCGPRRLLPRRDRGDHRPVRRRQRRLADGGGPRPASMPSIEPGICRALPRLARVDAHDLVSGRGAAAGPGASSTRSLDELEHNSAEYVHLWRRRSSSRSSIGSAIYGDPRFVRCAARAAAVSRARRGTARGAIDPVERPSRSAERWPGHPRVGSTRPTCARSTPTATRSRRCPPTRSTARRSSLSLVCMISPRGVQSRLDPEPSCVPGARASVPG